MNSTLFALVSALDVSGIVNHLELDALRTLVYLLESFLRQLKDILDERSISVVADQVTPGN